MGQACGLPAADEVLHAGVRAMACFEERQLLATGVDGDQLVAPAVGLLQGAQLRTRRRSFAAADDPHVGGPVAEFVAAGRGAEQPGQLDHAGVVEVAGLPVTVGYVLPVRLGHLRDRGTGAGVEVEPDTVAQLTTSAAWLAMLRVAARFTRYRGPQ